MPSVASRELDLSERRAIQKLIKAKCANYDWEYGCLLLDEDCPMMIIGFTNSALCKYFRNVVLYYDPGLQVLFQDGPVRICKNCGSLFPAHGNKRYCSTKCSAMARRRSGAKRIKKHREKGSQM